MLKKKQAAWKRVLDLYGSIVLLILSLPCWALIALAIKLDDGGPIIYRRRVMGKNGKQFDAFKFRTMVPNASAILNQNPALRQEFEKNYKLANDPRITRVGGFLRKTSLDELPQLLNVLYGQMSLVGPRMISPPELSKYGSHAAKLLSVAPGCAGPWVAAGRQEIPYEQRVRLDLQYLDNQSLWLDIKIFLKTIGGVLRMRGAC